MSRSSSRRLRWCPTREQITVLKELYRRGLTNPNGSQIQTITSLLSIYGPLHAKNVFYWFQNHKARDPLRIRNKIANQLHQQYRLQLHLFQQDTGGSCEDGLIDGRDLMDVGPIFPACCMNKPVETLQLFPLKSPTSN